MTKQSWLSIFGIETTREGNRNIQKPTVSAVGARDYVKKSSRVIRDPAAR